MIQIVFSKKTKDDFTKTLSSGEISICEFEDKLQKFQLSKSDIQSI